MSRKEKSRIDTSGGNGLGLNPFGGLGALDNLPQAPAGANQSAAAAATPNGKRVPAESVTAATALSTAGGQATGQGQPQSAQKSGQGNISAAGKRFSGRIDVRREKSGRGGKTVTTLSGEGLTALSDAERDALLKTLKNQFGCGGRREGALLEVQGNLAEQLMPVLSAMGWRAVRTGG